MKKESKQHTSLPTVSILVGRCWLGSGNRESNEEAESAREGGVGTRFSRVGH